jgi:hypothetical protein
MRRAGAMDYSLGNDKSLSWIELDGLVFQVNEQLAVDDVEELIIGIVLVPVILTLEDTGEDPGRSRTDEITPDY